MKRKASNQIQVSTPKINNADMNKIFKEETNILRQKIHAISNSNTYIKSLRDFVRTMFIPGNESLAEQALKMMGLSHLTTLEKKTFLKTLVKTDKF